jgi:hypothetical protein
MSRIIRLVSDVLTTSRFNKAMPAPIIIPPESTIALKSISFELAKDTTFDVPDGSYYFYYSVGDKDEQNRDIQYRVLVPQGTYTQDSLLQTLQFQMNQALSGEEPAANCYGFEWSLSVDTTGILTMSFDRADKAAIQSADVDLNNMQALSNVYTKLGADTGEYNAFMQVKPVMCRGGFNSEIQLGGTSPETSEFIVGLCPNIIQGGLTDVEAFSFAVFCDTTSGQYKARTLTGNIVTTTIDVQTGATIKIIKGYDTESSKGFIAAYQDDDLIIQQDVIESLINNIHYFTVAIGDGGADISFSNPALIQSPFVSKSPAGAYTLNKVAPSIYVSDLNTRAPSKVTVVFSSPAMQQFLGFLGTTLSLNVVSGSFTSNSPVAALVMKVGEDLIIELQNLPIEGYDTLSGLMAPIVAVIPVESLSSDASGLGFSYIEPFVTKVKLHNKSPLNVNTFYVNIRSGNSNLALADRVYMQLLVE